MVINLSGLVKFNVKDAYFEAAFTAIVRNCTAIVESNRDRPKFSKYLNVCLWPRLCKNAALIIM